MNKEPVFKAIKFPFTKWTLGYKHSIKNPFPVLDFSEAKYWEIEKEYFC